MKQIFRGILWLVLAAALSGCITDYTPKEAVVNIKVGESETFKVVSDDPSAKLVWYLDGTKVASGKTTFTYTAEQISGGTIVQHILTTREEGGIYSRLYRIPGMPQNFMSSVNWTIKVIPGVTPGCAEGATRNVTCGVGACAATGIETCVNGQFTGNTCVAGTPAAEVCDGIDNDCNGAVDNGIASTPTTCGIGACARTGVSACVNGAMTDSCHASTPTAEVCDGTDNDCNGVVDDGVASTPTTCGLGACQRNGESSCVNGATVNSCQPGSPSTEIGDGIDNDCDGQVDEGVVCAEGATHATTCGIGACVATGIETCVNGQFAGNTCVAGTPTAEVCDGIDNNCNGSVDDGIASTPTTCGIGACASTGELACVSGAMADSCHASTSTAEVCDGTDNDCNGVVDDGIASTPTTCGIGACQRNGESSCINGATVNSCQSGSPSTEIADGIDNDCDGQVDEGVVCAEGDTHTTTCGVGACVATGVETCVNGQFAGNTCVAGPPAAEVCDGIDNDCNGVVDNGIASTPTTCGIGACASTGELACVSGAMTDSCHAGSPSAEICDGRDNNCDGSVDEGIASTPTTCGIGACASTGVSACVSGAMTDSCHAGTPSAEICDGRDNNCNGSVDDGIASTPTTCGIGACASTGVSACVNGSMTDSCHAGTPSAETCDGRDNNCNGSVDDGIASTPTTCGIGACASTGVSACVNGSMSDSCHAGTPSAETCDGRDNNCNGSVDEGIASTPTTCGIGACASTGVSACVNGSMSDSCVAGTPSAETCDGRDNNCNGSVDEGIASTPTTCGIGACASTGVSACVNGSMSDSCVAGTPSAETCDGRDNNCNGSVDDGIASTPTTCGIGACASTGVSACVNGSMSNSCVAGTPSAEICDGRDNNCNGTTDEGVQLTFYRDADGDTYGNAAVTIQACAAPVGYVANSTDCNDTLAAVYPGAEEVCANSIDENCNGESDEGCQNPDILAQDGLNLLIDHLQAYMISGDTPTSIEDILPTSVLNDIRLNYFQAAISIDANNPSAHLGLAVLELVQIAYDVDSVAIIDFMLSMLTGTSSSSADLGAMAEMLFGILDSNAADYLNNALVHMAFAVNLNTDIVLQLYMPIMLTDASGNPVLDPTTGRPQFQKDADGHVMFETEKSSYQLDRTDVVLVRGVINLGVGALHLYNAYDLDIAGSNGTYDYFGEIQKDPVTDKLDITTVQGLLLALEFNDKRSGFLTMRSGGQAEAQASLIALRAAITDVKAGLTGLAAETDDQTDDIVTIERMATIYGSLTDMVAKFAADVTLPAFSFATMRDMLDRLELLLNSTATNRFSVNYTMADATVINLSVDLSRVFTGALTNLHQYLPYHYWFTLDNTTAYPANSTKAYKTMVDGKISQFYGIRLPVPLNANYTAAELAGKTFLGPALNLGSGLIGNSTINIDNMFADVPTLTLTLVFPDITFGGLVQGLTQAEVDAVMASISSTLFSMQQ